jgi:hypothetical protein
VARVARKKTVTTNRHEEGRLLAAIGAPAGLDSASAERSGFLIGATALLGLAILAFGLAALPDWIFATIPGTRVLGRRRFELFLVGSGALIAVSFGLLLNHMP